MGRPLNPRYFGTTAAGGDETGEENLSVTVKVGTNPVSYEGIILNQKGETEFTVNDAADGEGNTGICRLVDKAVPEEDEMVLIGTVNGSGDEVNIRKVQNRTVTDFSNNKYTWEIQDDSTTNVLVLFEI